MQISQGNSPSFGINMVRFECENAKTVFLKKTSNIREKAMTKMWDQISNIKPKYGDDVDVVIHTRAESWGERPFTSLLSLACKNGESTVRQRLDMPNMFDKYSPKKIIKAFKELVGQVDWERMPRTPQDDLVVFSKKVGK